MKRQLTKLEQNIVKGIAIVLSLPVLISMVDRDTTAIVEEAPAAIAAVVAPAPAPPVNQYCIQDRVQLTLQTYNICIREGMSYYEVANTIGIEGDPSAQSGAISVYGWNGLWARGYVISEGRMSATFSNGKLVSKSQYGLPSDPDLY